MLNRLDYVNDAEENKRITSLWHNRLFVACFTHSVVNEKYLYDNYGEIRLRFKTKNIKADTVCFDEWLKQPLKNTMEDYQGRSDLMVKECDKYHWCVRDVTVADMFYTDDFNDFIADDGFESNGGLIKHRYGKDNDGNDRNWEAESETRIRIAVRPIGFDLDDNLKNILIPDDFKHLYIPLPEIDEISYCADASKDELKKLLKEYDSQGKLYS